MYAKQQLQYFERAQTAPLLNLRHDENQFGAFMRDGVDGVDDVGSLGEC